MKAIITVGISASGKRTWAKEFARGKPNWMIVCRDGIRTDILVNKLDRPLLPGELWKKWKFKDEHLVNDEQDKLLRKARDNKINIIVADTNLNRNRNKSLEERLRRFGFKEIEYKEFPVTFQDAVSRNNARPDGVGETVLWRQYKQWHEYIGGKVYVPDTTNVEAVIFDIDGTLAKMGARGPFEWHKVGVDSVRPAVEIILRGIVSQGFKVIIMSGRDSVCRPETEKWLADHKLDYDELFMRAANDMRKDNIVKEELFFKHVADNYNVKMVVDDRPQVVRLWTLLGLTVINVGEIHCEF